MRKFNFLIIFWCFLLILTSPNTQWCQSSERIIQWTIIDRSGSMRGYFNTNQIERLNNFISKENSSESSESYYFIDHEKRRLSEIDINEYGNNTYLKSMIDTALQANPKPPIVWLITDNQPSGESDSVSDKDIEEFYATLRSDQVKRISFFPLKINFQGDLYTADNQTLKQDYQGKRGLLVYALLLDEKYKDDFENTVSNFEKAAQSELAESTPVKRILIKPLERETVTARLVSIEGEKLSVEDGKIIIGSDFNENQPISGRFGIDLSSNLGSIKIDRATIDAKEGVFSTNDFSTPHPKASINPQKIENFIPGNNEPFHITLSLQEMKVENTLSSIWHSLSSARGDINGDIFISINVPSSQFSPVNEFRDEFSTDKNIFNDPSPTTQERIYNLKGLLEQMQPAEEQIIKPRINDNSEGRIPVKLSVRYNSAWRAFLLIIPLFLIGFLIIGVWFLSRNVNTSKYRLTWDNERYLAQSDFALPILFGGKEIKIDNKTVARLKKSFSGLKVIAGQGYKANGQKSQSLTSLGSEFYMERDNDGRTVNFQFKRLNTNSANKRRTSSEDWENDGTDYYLDMDDYDANLVFKMPTFGENAGEDSSGQNRENTNSSDFFD